MPECIESEESFVREQKMELVDLGQGFRDLRYQRGDLAGKLYACDGLGNSNTRLDPG